jgi:4-diphosphocytidyl-2-C-methyl-D-erythritol kinase
MNSVEMLSSAKINLSIDVLGKRDDGYHEVEMILHEVDLSDVISLKKISKGIEINCPYSCLPADDRNIAYKAAQVFFEHTGINGGTGITIYKNIPVSAGLGGGSSNAAHVLMGLDRLYETGLGNTGLTSLSEKLGSDVPFFINGGTAFCRGRGEITEAVKTDVVFDILIVKPDIAVSTKDIYAAFRPGCVEIRPDTKTLINALKANDAVASAENMVNVLEYVTLKLYPEIRDIKTKLSELGALNSMMSGSGSAVFGIFRNRYDATLAADHMAKGKYQKYIVRTRVR